MAGALASTSAQHHHARHAPTRSSSLRHSTTAAKATATTTAEPQESSSPASASATSAASASASGAAQPGSSTANDSVTAVDVDVQLEHPATTSKAQRSTTLTSTTTTTRSPSRPSRAKNNKNKHSSTSLDSSANSIALPPPPRRVGPHGVPFLPAYSPADTLCAFCGGTKSRNRHHRAEELVSCYECGSSGHPTCLEWDDTRIVKRVKEYAWLCQECKRCEVCDDKGDDADMLFCDSCDRGWHRGCLTPPMTSVPRGKWACPTCKSQAEFSDGASTIVSGSRKRIHVLPPKPPLSTTPRSERSQRVRRSSSVARGDVWDHGEQFEWGRTGTSSSRRHSVSGASTRKDRKGKGRDPTRSYYDPFADNDLGPRVILPSNTKKRRRDETHWMQQVAYLQHLDELEAEQEAANADPFEHEDPWAGHLRPDQAETKGRVPNEEDRRRFKRAKDEVEARQLRILRAPRPPPTPAFPPPVLPPLQFGTPSHHSPSHFSQMPALSVPDSGYTGPQPVRSHHSPGHDHPGTPAPGMAAIAPSDFDELTIANGIPIANIRAIRFGEFEIETWYQAPFPEEYSRVADGRLWICEFCLKYMKGGFQASRHRLKCKTRHPPGDEIYRDGSVSVFEVDGRKNKIYCQNLCLLAKMFLDHKTLYYDVEPFLFYVMTTAEVTGAKFVGYFSKEKRSPTNNVSCIMTLPVRQRKGWGNLLIDFSYLLSKKEGRVGTPERPLSDLGLLSYRNYWTLIVCQYLHNAPDPDSVTIQEISEKTAMTPDDIYFVLKEQGWIVDTSKLPSPELVADPASGAEGEDEAAAQKSRQALLAGSSRPTHVDDPHLLPTVKVPEHYRLTWDRQHVAQHVRKWERKQYLTLKPENLQWSPFLVTRGFGLDANVGSTAKDGTAQMRNAATREGDIRSPERGLPVNIGALANGGGAQWEDGGKTRDGRAIAGPSTSSPARRIATSALVNGAQKASGGETLGKNRVVEDSETESEEDEDDEMASVADPGSEADPEFEEDGDDEEEEEEEEEEEGSTVGDSPPPLPPRRGRPPGSNNRRQRASEPTTRTSRTSPPTGGRELRSRASTGGQTNGPTRRLSRGTAAATTTTTNGHRKTPTRARSVAIATPVSLNKRTRSSREREVKISPELGRSSGRRRRFRRATSSILSRRDDSDSPELEAGDGVIEETPDAAVPVATNGRIRANGKGKQIVDESEESDESDENEDDEVAGMVGLTS